MNKKNLKRIVTVSLAIVMLVGTVAIGAGQVSKRKLEATFGRVKFNYNGQDVTQQVENKYGTPGFIAEDRSYVPVRALADVLGVQVNWDPSTYTVNLTGGGNTAQLENQLVMKDLQIAQLEEKIRKLEGGGTSSSGMSLRDMESDLVKKYDPFEKVDLRINLRGDARSIDLEVEVDLSRSSDRDRWDDIRERDIERLIEDMVSDVQREFRDADVKGYIKDTDKREDLYTFERRRNDSSTTIKHKGSSSGNVRDFERELERNYSSALDGIRNLKFEVKESKNNEFEIKILLDYDRYEKTWKELPYSESINLFEDIEDDLKKEFRNAKIDRMRIVKKDGGSTLAEY